MNQSLTKEQLLKNLKAIMRQKLIMSKKSNRERTGALDIVNNSEIEYSAIIKALIMHHKMTPETIAEELSNE